MRSTEGLTFAKRLKDRDHGKQCHLHQISAEKLVFTKSKIPGVLEVHPEFCMHE